jgi:hypothetical protein
MALSRAGGRGCAAPGAEGPAAGPTARPRPRGEGRRHRRTSPHGHAWTTAAAKNRGRPPTGRCPGATTRRRKAPARDPKGVLGLGWVGSLVGAGRWRTISRPAGIAPNMRPRRVTRPGRAAPSRHVRPRRDRAGAPPGCPRGRGPGRTAGSPRPSGRPISVAIHAGRALVASASPAGPARRSVAPAGTWSATPRPRALSRGGNARGRRTRRGASPCLPPDAGDTAVRRAMPRRPLVRGVEMPGCRRRPRPPASNRAAEACIIDP